MMMTDMTWAFDSVQRCPHTGNCVDIQQGPGMPPSPSPHCSNHSGPQSDCHCSNWAPGTLGSCMSLSQVLEEQQIPGL